MRWRGSSPRWTSFSCLSLRDEMLTITNFTWTLVGGQAVMEGVMMRSPHSYCVAVRKPNGEIVTEESPLPRLSEQYPIFKLPVLRGLGTLGQAMWLGMKALRFSANCALEDVAASHEKKCEKSEVASWAMGLNVLFSLVFFIALYKFVPLYLATLLLIA